MVLLLDLKDTKKQSCRTRSLHTMKLADNEVTTKKEQHALGTVKTNRSIETDFQWEREKQEAKNQSNKSVFHSVIF